MVRVLVGVTLGMVLAGCTAGPEIPGSGPTDPTADFDIIPPDVDTGWPDTEVDTGDTSDTTDTGDTGDTDSDT